jgi:hypothetical protein
LSDAINSSWVAGVGHPKGLFSQSDSVNITGFGGCRHMLRVAPAARERHRRACKVVRVPDGPEPTIQIEHHKTGATVNHPLEERLDDGSVVRFYEDAEAVLAHLTRRGIPMILREVEDGKAKPYSFSGMQKIVQRMRREIGLPSEFTLDACRHGGMTELEEAELTEGQGRALSAHRTKESYAVCQENRSADPLCNPEKACSLAGEPIGNIRSEYDR